MTEVRAMDTDVKSYVVARVHEELPSFVRENQALVDRVAYEVANAADGR